MSKRLCFGGRGLLEYIHELSIRAGDIMQTLLLLSFDSGRSRDTHTAFIRPRTLCHPNRADDDYRSSSSEW